MGNMMGFSDPITRTHISKDESSRIKFGCASVQGWRIDMEDAHVNILSVNGNEEVSFFAVYDGHGGSEVANYAMEHAHKRIFHHPKYMEGRFADAIQEGMLELDREMFQQENGETAGRNDLSGSTAVLLFIHRNRIFCGNIGDSRAVACVGGRSLDLSKDHKPSDSDEVMRITSAGGFIEGNRVNGNLALSRALGDFFFKRNEHKSLEEQVISPFADVIAQEITDAWEFVVMACDGIWDVMTSRDVVEFVRERIALGMEPEEICEDLVLHCLAPDCTMGGLGCDNMTAQLICLKKNGNYSALVEACSQPPTTEDPVPKRFVHFEQASSATLIAYDKTRYRKKLRLRLVDSVEYHYLKHLRNRRSSRLQIPTT